MHSSSSPLAASIHELQTLIMSFHPAIVIETVEEERVQTLLQEATQDMKMQLLEWSITQGLARSHGAANKDFLAHLKTVGWMSVPQWERTSLLRLKIRLNRSRR